MGLSKSSLKREIHRDMSLPPETIKISNKQLNLTSKATREKRTKKKTQSEKDRIHKDQSRHK